MLQPQHSHDLGGCLRNSEFVRPFGGHDDRLQFDVAVELGWLSVR